MGYKLYIIYYIYSSVFTYTLFRREKHVLPLSYRFTEQVCTLYEDLHAYM